MKQLRNHLIGVDQGDLILFSDFEHDGLMWTGNGPRQSRSRVTFSQPFRNAPAVHLSLSMWDMSNTTNARVDLQAEEVDGEGFVIQFRTWADTRVARVRVAWLAIGEVAHDDDWSVD
ncbi:MAG: hypothetical protein GC146_11275 [Limimaricola sp.]|uniref:H-type lectin domain-containing protein n=1 Tax=Limimaricola sp. TaxID=2211665 RepID=UPI001D9400DE|nr:H-type lectin domain-containing protein [Limimaricola sp.]MBI1417794.1 hypothetical protein [Limimaricola sp.]